MNMLSSIENGLISGPLTDKDGNHVFSYRFAADDPTFAGHFPERPILPGVFQIEITRRAASAILDRQLTIREVLKAKFRRPVLPDEDLTLRLRLKLDGESITANARFAVGDQPAGEALLLLCERN